MFTVAKKEAHVAFKFIRVPLLETLVILKRNFALDYRKDSFKTSQELNRAL